MGAAAVGITAVSSLMQAYGSIEQGRMAQEAAANDARTAEKNARLAREQAREQEMRFRASSRKQISSMTANYAASGITQEGSATEVLRESIANAEADALQIRRGGQLRTEAFMDEAESSRGRGRAARTLGEYGAVSSLVSGGARIASM